MLLLRITKKDGRLRQLDDCQSQGLELGKILKLKSTLCFQKISTVNNTDMVLLSSFEK